jgi:hypothetical protein
MTSTSALASRRGSRQSLPRVSRPNNPSRLSELGALRVLDPDKWARRVRAEMRKAGGRVPDAASALGVSVRQLYRWLDAKDAAGRKLFDDVQRAGPGPRPSDD